MMQMPLLSYPNFSQFLQLQQQQHLQQRYSRAFLSPGQGKELEMLSSQRSGTSCSEASTETPSPSPSPPLSITENFSSNAHQSGSKTAKSFTIDAILGIRDREMGKIDREHLNVLPSGFHSRLGLHLSGSHLDIPAGYGNSLDLSNSLERRLDVSRLSTTSRNVLNFQLPTDLTTASEAANFGNDVGRRDFHQISTFSGTNSCSRLSEKSTSEGSKKGGGKSKRVRTIFTPEQLERLEAEFERQQYMVGPERLYLAHTLQLTEAQVKVWFQNRRIKWRKQHLEIQQQRLAAMKQQIQRDEIENSDEESGDSNSFSFTTETNDNGGGQTFFKSVETNPERENASPGQFRDETVFQNENSNENHRKSEAGTKTV